MQRVVASGERRQGARLGAPLRLLGSLTRELLREIEVPSGTWAECRTRFTSAPRGSLEAVKYYRAL